MSKHFNLKNSLGILLPIFFIVFLFFPIIQVFVQALFDGSGYSLSLFQEILSTSDWHQAFINSLLVGLTVALISTLLGFLLAYGIHFTNIKRYWKKAFRQVIIFPMLLPTITYGFVLLYTFGRQGLLTQILGSQPFDIYGNPGVILGLVIYTLPIAFTLFNDSMQYVDTRFFVVSQLLGDNQWQQFKIAVLAPLTRTFGISIVQAFFMSFTDFGIPTSIGGQEPYITNLLYEYFMGAVPDFSRGAVIALTMLIPSIISLAVLAYLEKKNVVSENSRQISPEDSKKRDGLFVTLFSIVSCVILGIFSVLFIVPFVKSWPYELNFTLEHVQSYFAESALTQAITNSVWVALLTTVFGTTLAYLAAVITGRAKQKTIITRFIDSIAPVLNSIPGMVLGIAFLLAFTRTSIRGTFFILVVANIIHYFPTPYQMSKTALQKMNPNWENTATIMGDSWLQILCRILIPNSWGTIIEVASYYFVNAMVTISAVIFLTSAKTMLMTTKIKELEHFIRFNDIFILSILLLLINIIVRTILSLIKRRVTTIEK
ncbi:ABC transporter permease subunit [Aerococcaceae bacterium 50-4]